MNKRCRFKVDKLVRDRISELLKDAGVSVFSKKIAEEEYVKRLKDKLLEETQEALSSQSPEQMIEELADLSEVIEALSEACGFSADGLNTKKQEKKQSKGGFKDRRYIASIEMTPDNSQISYYRSRPKE